MARYAVVTDLTRPRTDVILTSYEVRNDSTTPETVEQVGTVGFAATIYDASGVAVNESLAQKRNRLKTEFDSYAKRILDQANAGDTYFDNLKAQAIGYRFPAN